MSGEPTYEGAKARLEELAALQCDRAKRLWRDANETANASEGTAIEAAGDLDRAAASLDSMAADIRAVLQECERLQEKVDHAAIALKLRADSYVAAMPGAEMAAMTQLAREREAAQAEVERLRVELELARKALDECAQGRASIRETISDLHARLEGAEGRSSIYLKRARA